ncbi:MAG: type II secretion system protein N [Bdellovibrionales bacterium]
MSRNSSDSQNSHWTSKSAPLIFIILLSLLTADLATIYVRQFFLPLTAPPPRPPRASGPEFLDRSQYQSIVTRNICSSDNIIPDPLQGAGGTQPDQEVAPVPSSLPLALVGTLVHSNPEKSLAAIEIKGKQQVLSFSIKQNIENVATLERIERGKIIFRNTSNGRLEFIELPQTNKLAFESASKPAAGAEIKQIAEGQFELSKAELEKQLSDIGNLVQQAVSVPARRPGTGETYGFRILSIDPSSVLNQLVKPMDVITAANGSPVTNIQQAMEMYNSLRNSNRVCITIERDGRNKENCYNIK